MREKRKWFLKKPLIHFFFNTHYPDYWKWWWSWWLFLSRTNWIYFARFIGISELLFRASCSSPHPLNARLIRGLATSNLNPGTGMETGRTQSHQPANSINFSYLRPVNALSPLYLFCWIFVFWSSFSVWRRALCEGRTSQVVCDFCSFGCGISMLFGCFLFVCLL